MAFCRFLINLYFCVLLQRTITHVSGLLASRVHIVSPGFYSWTETPSLTHFAPALETGVAAARRKYPHTNWTAEILHTTKFADCFGLRDNIFYELSKWYYNRPYNESVLTVIIAPGCVESGYLAQLATGWDVLLITRQDLMLLEMVKGTLKEKGYTSQIDIQSALNMA
ncbi:hypothetical protein BV898_08355 [Hypsibius exemplaris]|uniref:Receptor ligand binding region domain-containing protein n=1 Tax=Hypsibius exemplaris TaxID=2072580 RepID=A0A1W0WQV8_HYPEX|nr:hypothetical protein BV898_08355 [Hypsibius exemplaris]